MNQALELIEYYTPLFNENINYFTNKLMNIYETSKNKKEFKKFADILNMLFDMLKDYMIKEAYDINDKTNLNELLIYEAIQAHANDLVNTKDVQKIIKNTNIIQEKPEIEYNTVKELINQYCTNKIIETGLYEAFDYFKI